MIPAWRRPVQPGGFGWGILLVLVFLSCRPESQPKTLDKVRTNLNPAMAYGPFMVAKDEGYFEEEGIDLEFVRIDASSALMAMTNGDLDVLSGPVRSGIFNLMLRGIPLQVVADKGHSQPGPCTHEAFTAPVAIADRIGARGGDLRGEKFALLRGGITEYLVDELLARRHVKRSEIELVQLPPGDFATSTSRRIDAIRYIQEPTLTNLVSKGYVKVIATSEEVAPGHQHGVVMYGKRLLREDRDLGVRFMRAYLRGVRRYNEGKTERNVAIISKYTNLPPDIIRRSCWLPVADDGRVRAEALQPLLDWAVKLDYLEGEIAVSQWWNPTFVDEANRTLPR